MLVVLLAAILIPTLPCQAIGKKKLAKIKESMQIKKEAQNRADSTLKTMDLSDLSAAEKTSLRISLVREYLGMEEPKAGRVRRGASTWNITTAYYQAPMRFSSRFKCSGGSCSAFQ